MRDFRRSWRRRSGLRVRECRVRRIGVLVLDYLRVSLLLKCEVMRGALGIMPVAFKVMVCI